MSYLNLRVKKILFQSRVDLQDSLNLGRCYAIGEEYFLHPGKVPKSSNEKGFEVGQQKKRALK